MHMLMRQRKSTILSHCVQTKTVTGWIGRDFRNGVPRLVEEHVA